MAAEDRAPAPTLPALKRTLGVFDTTMINVGTIVGSGVFAAGTAVASNVASLPMFFVVWAVAAGFSLLGALSVAELGAALPDTGGMYVYLREAYGPVWGYLYGWAECAVILAAGNAAVAVLFASYLGDLAHLGPVTTKLVACGCILVLTGLNVLGVRASAAANNLMTVGKVGLLLVLAIAAFLKPPLTLPAPSSPRVVPALTFTSYTTALLQPMWAFDGWVYAGCVGGEMKRPSRDLPLATILSVTAVALVYAVVTGSFLHVLGLGGLARTELSTTVVAGHAFGSAGTPLALGLVMLAVVGSLHGGILTGPRVLYAMAKNGMFFRAAATVHPRFRTPTVALGILAVWSVALVFTGRYEQLLTAALFTSWLFYALAGAAVVVLRKKRPDLPRPYRALGYPWSPVLFVLFAAYFLVQTVLSDPRDAGIGLGLVLSGLGPYAWFTRKRTPPASDADARSAR
ncbi:MAG: amino acid permease [Polyangiaceae bacterium]